jgi:parallel beta-helix repeat protein
VGANYDDDHGSNSGSAYVYDILTRPPPDPTNLANTVGNYWVNYTWQAGTGSVTDLYNVNMNGTWTNGTTAIFLNTSVGADGWANITVWAWNASGAGTLSAGCVSDEVQAPSEPSPPTLNCTCGNICVNTTGWWRDGGAFNGSGTPIQAAVDNATDGETIYVWNGSYTENVNVDKQLTLQGEGADVVTVTAADSDDNVFAVTADYVNISGFNATGAAMTDDGIYLNSADHCNIYENAASNNGFGIRLYSSSNNTLVNNTAESNNWCGIYLRSSSNNNTLANNNARSNDYGIYLQSSSNNNTLANNNASSNNYYGIWLNSSSSNLIYNNYFNNTNNALDDGTNVWNITNTSGTNIIGDSWLGGNYWSDYAGADTTGDGLGDTLTPYNSSGNISNSGDYHPLVQAATIYTPPDPTNLANTTGDYWVNYTWSPGMGNVTDSYNVNLNGAWTNETADAFVNVTVGPSGWANITVLAYNASGTGTLSEGSVSDSVQAPAGPLTIISIESVAAGRGESVTVPITVFNVVDMGGCEITFAYDPTVVYVTDVARGDLNYSFTYNINNGSGWMRANALDAYGQSGNVTFAYLTLAAVGNKSDTSEMEFEDSRLLDASYTNITHIRDNGTFSILPNVLPVVTNVSRTPDTILYDNGRPRTPGTNVTSLSAYMTDTDGSITAVTINLSSIGGSPIQPMEHVSGDVWAVNTTATEVDINAPDFTHQLTITATDDDGGINDSVSIELTVLKRGDVNGDGFVDKMDADYISRYLAGLEPEASSPPSVLAGDVAGEAGCPLGDGVVDLMDALYIARYTSNMEGEP